MFTNVDNWNSENIHQWKMIVGSVKISEHQKSHFTKERKKNFRRMNLMFYRGSKIEWLGSNFQPWSLDQNYFDPFETFDLLCCVFFITVLIKRSSDSIFWFDLLKFDLLTTTHTKGNQFYHLGDGNARESKSCIGTKKLECRKEKKIVTRETTTFVCWKTLSGFSFKNYFCWNTSGVKGKKKFYILSNWDRTPNCTFWGLWKSNKVEKKVFDSIFTF
jgi:hypothetical protein